MRSALDRVRYTRIRAPFAGTIVQRNVQVGEVVVVHGHRAGRIIERRPEAHELFGRRERERPEEHAVDHREDRDRGADADDEREDRCDREGRGPAE